MSPLVAGVDCSTQGTKVLLVDPESGSVEAAGRAPHTVTGSGGARETDPEVWWDALRRALAETGRVAEVVMTVTMEKARKLTGRPQKFPFLTAFMSVEKREKSLKLTMGPEK